MRCFNILSMLFLTFMYLISCDVKDNKLVAQRGEVKKDLMMLRKTEENLSIPIDEKTSNISSGISYYSNKKEWVLNFNHFENEIQIYDWGDFSFVKSLVFDRDDDSGLGNVFGFYVHNLDSIFLFPHNRSEIYITDTTGVIKSKIAYKVNEQYTPAFVLSSYFSSPPIVRDGKLIVKTHVQGNHREISDDELSNKHLIFSIDLENGGEVQFLPYKYPKGYLKDGQRHFEYSYASSSERIVFSLFADHNLYYANIGEAEIRSKEARSKYILNEFENIPFTGNRLDSYKYFGGSPHYESIIYDKYRNVYYRFCFPKVNVEEETEIVKLKQYPQKFSVMVLDDELNIIGETLFDKEKYYPNNSFITKEGLCISINHTDNPKMEENKMKFDLFKLEKLN